MDLSHRSTGEMDYSSFLLSFSHLQWKGRTAVKITLGALDSVQNCSRLPVLLRWSPVSPRQFNNHSLCYNNMAYFGMEGFNFPGSVHHLLGRLRPCAELIGGRVKLPTRWLELLLMSPFARSQRHSGGTNGWVLGRAGCKGRAHVLPPHPPSKTPCQCLMIWGCSSTDLPVSGPKRQAGLWAGQPRGLWAEHWSPWGLSGWSARNQYGGPNSESLFKVMSLGDNSVQ